MSTDISKNRLNKAPKNIEEPKYEYHSCNRTRYSETDAYIAHFAWNITDNLCLSEKNGLKGRGCQLRHLK